MWRLLLILTVCCSDPIPESFTLSVPDGPITVRIGSSIILPCSLSPAFTESLHVRWHRPDKYKTPILLYEKQQVQEQPADPQYRGRVSLIGELEKGNVSLKLDEVAMEDNGEFICFVGGQKGYKKASVHLTLKAVGSPPVLSVTYGGSGQVNVTCKSDGWSPKPYLTWRNNEGSEIANRIHHILIDAHGFVSVTSWLLYSSSGSEWISCSVGLSEEERKESRILPYISGTLTRELERTLRDKEAEIESLIQTREAPWKELFIGFIVLLLLAGIVVFILYKTGFIKYKDSKEASAVIQQDTLQASEVEIENLLKSEDLEFLKQKNTELQGELDETKGKLDTLKQQVKVSLLPTWDRVKDFKECLSMDGASVPGGLIICREGKSVKCIKPNNSQMLDTSCYVLCKNSFNSGQHYWEVRVGEKSQSVKQSWFVGVCSDTLRGQSGVSLDSRNDCWLLCYNKEHGLFVNTNPVTRFQSTTPLNRLGVFLDCSAQSLIFYDAESQSCLCTFFDVNTTHPLVPVLSPGERERLCIDLYE